MRGDMMRLPALVAVIAASMSACSTSAGHTTLDIDKTTVLVSDPVHVTVSGLSQGQEAVVDIETRDATGHPWTSSASFHADARGRIDLATAKPAHGTYSMADQMGLFWSMSASGVTSFVPYAHTEVDRVSVQIDGRTVASKIVLREFSGEGVRESSLRTPVEPFYGDFFEPADSSTVKPGVLVFGGSEGGLSGTLLAAQLASHGYPSLAIAYFHEPGLPQTLNDVPLEYFIGALTWLQKQHGVDPDRLVVAGASRGGEAALLLGADFPRLVHGVIALVPSAWVNCGYPSCDSTAWTLGGKPVPYLQNGDASSQIPVANIDGPVLVDCGGLDRVWQSCFSTDQIRLELSGGFAHPFSALEYPDAGHGIGTVVPYTNFVEPTEYQGRSRASDPQAREKAWPEVLSFLSAV